ncbi:MAG: Cys-tRNA(Pro) deacylase [Acidimicrobiales bacterium]
MTPAIKLLESRKIAHRTVSYDHDPSAASYGTEAAETLGIDPSIVFKTLLANVDTTLVVAVVPVTGMLDLKALARAARGKKATMADPAVAERTTGYVVGGISPLGQRKRLPTFVDESALGLDEMYVSGGRRGLEIVLAPPDLIAILGATTGPIAAQ